MSAKPTDPQVTANNDAISKPHITTLMEYLNYQYPATVGNIKLKHEIFRLIQVEASLTQSNLDKERLERELNQFKELSNALMKVNYHRPHPREYWDDDMGEDELKEYESAMASESKIKKELGII